MPDYAPDLTILRDMPASLMVLDRRLCYVTASQMYLDMVGMRLEQLVGRNVFEVFPETEERRSRLEQSMLRALAGEGNAIDRLPYAVPDPTNPGQFKESWWRCRHNPIYGPDGGIGHVVQITENITDLVKAEEQKAAIGHELQHRVGNLLSLVQVIARRTAGSSESLPVFLERFDGRMQAMARTHSYLIGTNWNTMSLGEVVARQLQHGNDDLAAQMTIGGPDVLLSATEAQMMSMALHELTTNSLKYGALRDRSGRLDVAWSTEDGTGYSFHWTESGVGAVAPSGRTGFGSMILDTIVPAQLGGTAVREFGPDGLHYRLKVTKRVVPT
ncbi:MAG TPA: HWE histidine kinase domain-containing protein [Tabrizicola sp.]|nr:HWE histidine kinase domain-containing protein [Tabrizicola sp.]